MLVLRQLASKKFTEYVEITYQDGTVVKLHTIRAQGNKVQLGFDAPLTVSVKRVKVEEREVEGAK